MAVNYNSKTVSDNEVKLVLESIAEYFGKDVNVTSGDRGVALTVGAGEDSLHLHHRAADFHIDGMDDGTAYLHIKVYASKFFKTGEQYECIWHGPYTETMGGHLHIGRKSTNANGYVKFVKEGVTSGEKGDYQRDVLMPIVWSARD
jgi:Peptidase M15.